MSLLSAINPPSKVEKEKPVKIEEKVEEPPQEEGWMEVGKKNKSVVTRTVSVTLLSIGFYIVNLV